MSRDITTAMTTESEKSSLQPLYLVKLEYDGGDVNVHSSLGTITFDGDDYLGIGKLGKIGALKEDSDITPAKIKLSITGIESSNISTALTADYQGRPITIWLGAIDQSTYTLIADPTVVFKGIMDVQTINLGQTAVIELSATNRIAAWDRSNVRRYNGEDQRSRFAGDSGLDYVTQAAEKLIIWGR